MSVQLEMRIANPAPSTHEGLRVEYVLRNLGGSALNIPDSTDTSGTLTLVVHDVLGNVVREMNGLTHQAMMNRSRVDPGFSRDELLPGDSWTWRVDYARHHWPLPAGSFEVQARYVYAAESIDVRTERQAVTVAERPVQSIRALRDDCVLEALSLFLETEHDGIPEHFHRLHNLGHPLAAWYSVRLDVPAEADEVFGATSSFFAHDTYDHFFRRWVLWTVGAQIHGRMLESGVPVGAPRVASLPEGARILPAAFWDGGEDVCVFVRGEGDLLQCLRLGASELEPVFSHRLELATAARVAIGVDLEHIHVVTRERRLAYDRLDRRGALLERRTLFDSRLQLFDCWVDSLRHRALASYWDGPGGRTVHLVVVDLSSGSVVERRFDGLRVSDDIVELAFDVDAQGRFHYVVATTGKDLLYFRDESGPEIVARGEARFFPHVVHDVDVYLGHYSEGKGYRFVEYDRYKFGRRLDAPGHVHVDYD